MKVITKLSYVAAIVATMFTSCTETEILEISSTTVPVTLTAEMPTSVQTRSFGDGTTATVLDYAVYKVDKSDNTKLTLISAVENAATFTEKETTIGVGLPYGYSYKIILFARSATSEMKPVFGSNSATLSMPYSDSNTTLTANNENWDCFFYVYETGTVTESIEDNVGLSRPMAQLNIGTSDLTSETVLAVFENNLDDLTVSVTLPAGLPTQLDLFTDKASSVTTKEITLSYTGDPRKLDTGDFPVEPSTYDYVFMTYLLPGVTEEEEETAVVSQTLNQILIGVKHSTMETSVTYGEESVPLKRNYRTNIYGSLLSTSSDALDGGSSLTMTINSDWNEDDGSETLTDGKVFLTVSGYYKGYPYVQLTDNLCVAVYNIGSDSPDGYGDYFYWGALAPIYKNSSYEYKSSSTAYYLPDKEMVSISGDPTYDVAAYEWGGDWRLPANGEWGTLVNNCTVQVTSYNGVAGVLLTSTASGYEGNNLFLPLAGYYNGRKVTETTTYGYYWTGYYWADNAPYSLILTTSGVYQTAYYMLYYNEGATIRPFFTK